jgi:hypothetical protein
LSLQLESLDWRCAGSLVNKVNKAVGKTYNH